MDDNRSDHVHHAPHGEAPGQGSPLAEHTGQHEQAGHEGHHEQAGHEGTPPAPTHAGHVHEGTPSAGQVADHGESAHVEHPSGGVGHSSHGSPMSHEESFRRRFWVSLALSIPVLLYSEPVQRLLGITMPSFPGSDWIAPLFSLIVFAYGGVPFLQMALPEVRGRRPGMMTLISLAISVALIYSVVSLFLPGMEPFFWELVTLVDIMLLGHWVEMRSVRQASGALDELARLLPDTAERLLPDGATEEIAVSALRDGDVVLVRPGGSVPADGVVQEGESEVNEAMITGESQPVTKAQGDPVIAGTLNGSGSLRVRVTATGDHTALAGIMRLVAQAQESKSRSQVLADRAAGWLFYVALGVALVTALAWSVAQGFDARVVARVATVLVIACPHALGLAVPLVVAITTSLGARHGILVRDRRAMESLRQVDTVILDKTGTLTRGEFGLTEMATNGALSEDSALALAAAVEHDSEHTIARAIVHAADECALAIPEVSDFEALQGRGVRARADGHAVQVVGDRLLAEEHLDLPPALAALRERASARGQSVVYLIRDEEAVAALALADLVRAESRAAVASLHAMGMQVAMLTGDTEAVAHAAAEDLGIDHYFAQVLPEQKAERVAELQRQGHRVAMVGDGVNDAPALARADVGIAIGGGTDVAIESAGIILVRNDPRDVVAAITLSRASYRKMQENLAWAAGYNIIALPLAAGILEPVGIALSLAVGALLMSLSTVIVAINAQRLRGVRLGTA